MAVGDLSVKQLDIDSVVSAVSSYIGDTESFPIKIGNAGKFVRVNATEDGFEYVTSTGQRIYQKVLNATDINNKYIVLPTVVSSPNAQLFIKGAPAQYQGEDFNLSINLILWNGLGLDGLLQEGHKVYVVYE